MMNCRNRETRKQYTVVFFGFCRTLQVVYSMSEYKPSRFEVYFRSSSVFVQCLIVLFVDMVNPQIFTASLLILSPISTLIGVTTWIMMSVSLTTAYLVWKESNSLTSMEGTNSTYVFCF